MHNETYTTNMELTSTDTFGGYRIEFCSKNDKEKELLIEIEKLFHKKDLKFLESIKSKLNDAKKNK